MNNTKTKTRTLKECIETLTKEEINTIYEEITPTLKSDKERITQKDKIEAILVEITSNFMISSFTFTDKEVNQIDNLINEQNLKDISSKILKNKFAFKIEDNYIIPEEIKQMHNYNKETNQIEKKKLMVIEMYLLINGVLEINKLIELLKVSGLKTTKTEIKNLVKEEKYIINNNLIYLDNLAKDLDEKLQIHDLKKELPYREFSIEEIIATQIEMENESYEKRISSILSKKIKNKDKITRFSNIIMHMIIVGYNYEENIEELLKEEKISLNEKEKEKLLEIADEIHWYFPSWELNGYAEAELDENNFSEDLTFEDLSPKDQIESYIHVYLTINGVIEIDKLLEILTTYHKYNITRTDLIKIASSTEEITIFNNYICIEGIEEILDEIVPIKNILNKHKIVEDIDEMINEFFDITNRLIDLKFEYNLGEELVITLEQIMHMGEINNEVLSAFLEDEGYDLSPKKQKELLKKLLPIQKDVRVWTLNGFKKSELTNLNKREKIGRNDRCPCGSGKKYKNCCLRG